MVLKWDDKIKVGFDDVQGRNSEKFSDCQTFCVNWILRIQNEIRSLFLCIVRIIHIQIFEGLRKSFTSQLTKKFLVKL